MPNRFFMPAVKPAGLWDDIIRSVSLIEFTVSLRNFSNEFLAQYQDTFKANSGEVSQYEDAHKLVDKTFPFVPIYD